MNIRDMISFLHSRSLWVAFWRDLARINVLQVAARRNAIYEGDKAGQDAVSHGTLDEICWRRATSFHLLGGLVDIYCLPENGLGEYLLHKIPDRSQTFRLII